MTNSSKKIKEDGTYDEIYERWINNALTSKLPEIEYDKSKEPIHVATFSGTPPMSFIQNGELVGFEIELGMRFGEFIGRPIEWCDMYFSGIIPSLVSGKQDMAMASISITEERQNPLTSVPHTTAATFWCAYERKTVQIRKG